MKRPSLELVDSHSFVTDEKSSKGPRIIETELSKTELIETVSRSSVEYASSTVEPSDEEDDTTPLMEKLAIDLYAILQNENAKEDDKKKFDGDETTVADDDEQTTVEIDTDRPSSTTTTTTPAPTTTRTTTTTTEATTTTTEAPKGRGVLTAGRNRFSFKGKGAGGSTEAPAEASTESFKPKNRFSRPSAASSPSFSRNGSSRASKTTSAPEEVKETVEKSEASSSQSKLPSKNRNRFNPRGPSAQSTTEKSDSENTTASRLVKPRPQFSLRNRGRSGVTTAAPAETNEAVEESADEEKPAEKTSSIVPRPTSRLNLNRPTVSSRLLPGQKPRTSPLNSRRTNEENNDGSKSANENESDLETTTQNNLNKLKSRPRIQINTDAKAKKTASPAVVNRKVNPLISKRKFGVTSTTGEPR